MWKIVVSFEDDRTWCPIWSADGEGAAECARERFCAVRAQLSGKWDGEDNQHAARWEAVRLLEDDVEVDSYDRTIGTTPPPPVASSE